MHIDIITGKKTIHMHDTYGFIVRVNSTLLQLLMVSAYS